MAEGAGLDTLDYQVRPARRSGPLLSELLGLLAALAQLPWCLSPITFAGGHSSQWQSQVYESFWVMLPSVIGWLLASYACYAGGRRRSGMARTTLLLVVCYAALVSVLKLNTFYRWF